MEIVTSIYRSYNSSNRNFSRSGDDSDRSFNCGSDGVWGRGGRDPNVHLHKRISGAKEVNEKWIDDKLKRNN